MLQNARHKMFQFWKCWEIFISLMSTLWRATNYIIRMRVIVPPSSLGHDECNVASWLIHE